MFAVFIWVLALTLACWAGWLDWKSRRIPNWLTVPGLVLGVVVNTAVAGWPGAKGSLAGAGLCLLLLFPFVVLRGLGAGDWKLMGALGALLGPRAVSTLLLVAILVAGLMGVAQMVARRRVLETLRNLWLLICVAFTFRSGIRSAVTLDNPHALKLPFGVAAALATIACFSVVLVRLHMRL